MRAHRLACVALSLLAGLLLAAGAVRFASAGSAAAPSASPAPPARLLGGRLSASAPLTCTTVTVTHTRPVDVWYGSTFVAGSAVTDVAKLSDHLSGGLATEIFNDSRQDPQVRNSLGAWLTSTTDISWTLAPGENLPAAANLRAALASVVPPFPLNAIRFDQPISHGVFSYNVVNWDTVDHSCIVHNIGNAVVSYVEQDARAAELVFLPLVRR